MTTTAHGGQARTVIRGRGVSGGVGVGPVVRMAEPVPEPAHDGRHTGDGDARDALRELAGAIDTVQEELRRRAGTASGEVRDILLATMAMAGDTTLHRSAEQLIEAGASPQSAVWRACGGIADAFAGLDGVFAQRVRDVEDVRDRLISALDGRPAPGVPHRDEPFVLVAHDLAPADTATLNPAQVTALVTASGGPTSHTAILARSLGIPAIVAAPDAATLVEDSVVLVDGDRGSVVVGPAPDEIARSTEGPDLAAPFRGTAATADGHRVVLLANVGDAEAADGFASGGAEGIGLFRTEVCFLNRTTRPGVAEQTGLYRTVLSAAGSGRAVVRTLDAGADKPMAFLPHQAEPNPALGVRGYRMAGAAEGILEDQLAAIAQAGQDVAADVWVMAPMIATPAEAYEFARAARRPGISRVGVMIEVPSAALCADEILTACDFVSVGTNDLTQYTMAADRELGGVAALNDPWQPAVLRLVERVANAGTRAGKPVGVCGEAAADPALACVLVGMGVNSLSMTPRAVTPVARRLGDVTVEQCRRMAAVALAADSPESARAGAEGVLDAQ
ncbi:phosphoenolpyruvate--protein phosphotransferase [Streptomyces sp. AJS327]|uniref:phosphoenolpyruvate--protein phosphotransferase n=1 Tax=Streptomyces sp. AJS327 TaxID=2545265 RepID=UPI0015DD668F|nr:phosphoenolpyruvate--protein phosphotransferase [Streptomyces sp. AJS327]MBA0051281.1 phosphoenolpyruvate--protein phosphotransferase [Streptomyces sp. AJS327]